MIRALLLFCRGKVGNTTQGNDTSGTYVRTTSEDNVDLRAIRRTFWRDHADFPDNLISESDGELALCNKLSLYQYWIISGTKLRSNKHHARYAMIPSR